MSVAKEQICIRPLIQYAENKFQQGASVREVLSAIPNFSDKSKRLIHNISPQAKLVHELGTSTPVLAGIIVFEAARHHLARKGVHVPSSLDILSHTVSAASLTPPKSGNSGGNHGDEQMERWIESQQMQDSFRRPGKLPRKMRRKMEK